MAPAKPAVRLLLDPPRDVAAIAALIAIAMALGNGS